MRVVIKGVIVNAMQWFDPTNIKVYEEFIGKYPDYSFEYTTKGGWIIKWKTSYHTMKEGDILIIGYKNMIEILSKEEFSKNYEIIYSEE